MKFLSIIAVVFLPLAAIIAGEAVFPAPALKDLCKDDFLVGVAVGPYIDQGEDRNIGALVVGQFNCHPCENSMKCASVNPAPGVNSFPLKRTNHPLLFDRAGLPKPAFCAVAEVALKSRRSG